MAELVHVEFAERCQRFPEQPFLATPPNPERAYLPEGLELTYAQAEVRVGQLERVYREGGLGHGHRVALQLENHPALFLHRLALQRLGASLVPLNPDHTVAELRHVFERTRPELVVLFERHRARLEQAAGAVPLVRLEDFDRGLPGPRRPAPEGGAVGPRTETCVLFTSGTTGQPKGCRFDHAYETAACEWYRTRGGRLAFRPGQERLYSPLPLFHSNTGVHAFLEMLATGGCLVTSDRFRSGRWWAEVHAARATCLHYLGVIMAMLYQLPPSAEERNHQVRFAIGAGVEPTLHAAFEARFGFPLVEIWGMTEIMRYLCDQHEPRQVGTRAFGRAQPGLEVRLVDDGGADVSPGQPGELLVRHSQATPRRGFFAGYLDEPEATEQAWRGGWFHTGDVAVQDAGGGLHFFDRKKHLIRRAGQNIAAAEVEAALIAHPAVREVAVVPVPDPLREEEVLACVVPSEGQVPGPALARALFDHALQTLAYYKAPGWVLFVAAIPRTGSQKMMKYALFPPGVDPRQAPGAVDLRAFKKRESP